MITYVLHLTKLSLICVALSRIDSAMTMVPEAALNPLHPSSHFFDALWKHVCTLLDAVVTISRESRPSPLSSTSKRKVS